MTYSSFLPDYVVRLLADRHDVLPLVQRADGVAMFADIVGFTPMSAALADVGPEGTEELSEILNSFFARMIDLVTGHGGTVAKFAGDALTALFPFDYTTRSTVRRAAGCALAMQGATRGFQTVATRAGTFPLAMRAGLGAGRVLAAVVGDPAIRLEHVLAGEAVDRAVAAERRAASGQVVADATLLDRDHGIEVAGEPGAPALVTRLSGRPRRTASRQPPIAASAEGGLAAFLHPAIAERIRSGHGGLVDEHRTVTMAFIGFPDLVDDAARRAAADRARGRAGRDQRAGRASLDWAGRRARYQRRARHREVATCHRGRPPGPSPRPLHLQRRLPVARPGVQLPRVAPDLAGPAGGGSFELPRPAAGGARLPVRRARAAVRAGPQSPASRQRADRSARPVDPGGAAPLAPARCAARTREIGPTGVAARGLPLDRPALPDTAGVAGSQPGGRAGAVRGHRTPDRHGVAPSGGAGPPPALHRDHAQGAAHRRRCGARQAARPPALWSGQGPASGHGQSGRRAVRRQSLLPGGAAEPGPFPRPQPARRPRPAQQRAAGRAGQGRPAQ